MSKTHQNQAACGAGMEFGALLAMGARLERKKQPSLPAGAAPSSIRSPAARGSPRGLDEFRQFLPEIL
jgi:hypothetical protein